MVETNMEKTMKGERISHHEACDLIDEIREFRESELNDWEREFLESIYNSNYPELTSKRTACLYKIFDRTMR